MNRKRMRIIEGNEISKMVTYTLGGYEQKVLIEGKSKKNPVIISLHGGPGSPIPFSEGCRGMFPEFTDKAIMVYWDQLGCGINNHLIDDKFSIESFVEMTADLIKEIRKEFPDNYLILFGTSWGSILAAKAAAKVPELIDHVITSGQVLFDMIFNDEVFAALENANLTSKEKYRLQEIKTKSNREVTDGMTLIKLIRKYTEGYTCKSGGKTPLFPILMGLLTSPDYKFKDFKAIVLNGYQKNTSLLKELFATDLRDTLTNITVPYLILQGSTDIVTSTKAIQEFVDGNQFEQISYKIIPNCGHMPSKNGMETILDECVRIFK